MRTGFWRKLQNLGAPVLWTVVGALAGASMLHLEPSLSEEGGMLHLAQRLVSGEHLYRDIFWFTGPLPFETLAALFRTFGEEIVTARAAVLAMQALATGATFALARRAGAGALSHVAAASVATAPLLLFPFFTIFFYSTFACHLTLLLAYVATRGVDSNRWAIATGVLVACVALSKQSIGLALAVGLSLTLAATAPRGRGLERAASLALGGAAIALVTIALFLARGELSLLFHSLVVIPLSLGDSFSSGWINFWPVGELAPGLDPPTYLPRQIFETWPFHVTNASIAFVQLLYALPWLAGIATAARRLTSPLRPALWINLTCLAALTTNLFPRIDWGHLAVALPSAVIQLVLVAGAGARAPIRQGLLRGVIATSLVAALLASATTMGLWRRGLAGAPTFGPRVDLKPVSPFYKTASIPNVIAYLRDRVHVKEAIFVARAEPLLYFATDTSNPTPYAGSIPGFREQQEREVLAGLADVRYVVMSDRDGDALLYYARELPAVQAYLERYFGIPADFELDAAGDAPFTWIYVLERGADRGASVIDLSSLRSDSRSWYRDLEGALHPVTGDPPPYPARFNQRRFAILLGPRGGGGDFSLELPDAPVFRTSVGRVGIALDPEHFPINPGLDLVVSVGDGDGDAFTPLASVPALIDPSERDPWKSVEVDLAAFAKQRVTLRIEIAPARPAEEPALLWLGSPHIATTH